jgi:hypothetical protein
MIRLPTSLTILNHRFLTPILHVLTASLLSLAAATAQLVPDIAVEQPVGTVLVDGTSSIAYGSLGVGSSSAKTFTIRNTGTANLTGLAVTKNGTHSAQFIISTVGMATTLAPGASTTFAVTFTPTGTAVGNRVAAIQIANNDPDEKPFDIALTGFGYVPEIAVEHPVATNLVDGTASISYGTTALDSSTVKVFTIKNLGSGDLTGLTISKDGSANAQFIIDTNGLISPLPAGASTTFSVAFRPTGGNGTRTAAIHIASNDANENPFDITLSGQAYSGTADTDGDGLNDLAEIQLSALGFNWQTSQPALVAALTNGASAAGLYAPAQMQTLRVGSSLVKNSPDTPATQLTFGLKKGASPFPFSASATSLNASGNLEFLFTAPEPGAIFKVLTD